MNIHKKRSKIRILRFLAIPMWIKSFIFFPLVNKLFSIQDSIKKKKNEKFDSRFLFFRRFSHGVPLNIKF